MHLGLCEQYVQSLSGPNGLGIGFPVHSEAGHKMPNCALWQQIPPEPVLIL